jgi:hypothetical protein
MATIAQILHRLCLKRWPVNIGSNMLKNSFKRRFKIFSVYISYINKVSQPKLGVRSRTTGFYHLVEAT